MSCFGAAVLHVPSDCVVEFYKRDPIKVTSPGTTQPATESLSKLARRTIPYLVVYSPDGNEIFASDATPWTNRRRDQEANSTALARD